MSRRKRWEELGIKDGFGQIRFLRWRYFIDYINQHMLDYDTYIWRGHRRDDWSLQSTLDRLLLKAIPKSKHYDYTNSHLERFKYAVRGRRGPNPSVIESENDWWALGQHHGLATPLLDWTESPFAAAYFALVKKGTGATRFRAIYALHRPSIEIKVRELIQKEAEDNANRKKEFEKKSGKPLGLLGKALFNQSPRPQIEFIRPRSDENQRLVSQNGLFTRAPSGITLEEWVQKNFVGDDGYTLMKLLIPDKDRAESLRMLNRMNINHVTLFPDLYGASKYCNLFAEVEKY